MVQPIRQQKVLELVKLWVIESRIGRLHTNDKCQLAEHLARDVSHRSAIEPNRESVSPGREVKPLPAPNQVHEHLRAEGHSISR